MVGAPSYPAAVAEEAIGEPELELGASELLSLLVAVVLLCPVRSLRDRVVRFLRLPTSPYAGAERTE